MKDKVMERKEFPGIKEHCVYLSLNRIWRLFHSQDMEGRHFFALENKKKYKSDYPSFAEGRVRFLFPERTPSFVKKDVRNIILRWEGI